jgi:5'-3' exonuclease
LKCWREQKADHVVFCLEGRSWRKDFYAPYKANRKVLREAMTETQQETDRMFYDAYDELCDFFKERSNCTVLQHPQLEADDLIAGWVQSHPDDNHVIVSSDSDYYQLIAENVKIFNGVTEETHTITGIFDKKNAPVLDKTTKEPKAVPDPAWLLFEKCVRGDSGDNVFSAYPGVRTKGTKNKTGLLEAFADRGVKGFAWNNLMLQQWLDHDNVMHTVGTDYERNRTLIDLTAQPEHIRAIINETIQNTEPKAKPMVGAYFMKFCGKHDLVKISDNAQQFTDYLGAAYPK